MSSSPTSCLYTDALHSIFSVLHTIDSTEYRDILSVAATCHEWCAAVQTMKWQRHKTALQLAFPYKEDEPTTVPLAAMTMKQLEAITKSRLRTIVGGVRILNPLSLYDLMQFFSQISFADCMAHLRTLSVVVTISQDVTNEHAQLQRLPSSLESLDISMQVPGSPLTFLAMLTQEVKNKTESGVRQKIFNNVAECMSVLATAVAANVTTNVTVSRLTRLEMSLYVVQKAIPNGVTSQALLPSHALAPWSDTMSLRYLNLHQPTVMCIHQVRRMNQLNRVDGFKNGSQLRALIDDPAERDHIATLPQLTYLHTPGNAAESSLRLISCLSWLQHLSLADLACDSLEVLLPKLPNLTSLAFQTTRLGMVEPKKLLNEIMQYASQLQYLHLLHAWINEAHMYTFLPEMKYLQSLSLRQTEIGCLECFTVSLPVLKNLELVGLPINSADELRHLKHIVNVVMKDCDSQWKSMHQPPAARLVGVELNPGPITDEVPATSPVLRLCTDELHSIFSALHTIDSTEYGDILSVAATCYQWYKAVETMKWQRHESVLQLAFPYKGDEPTVPLAATTMKQLDAITKSRLRTIVNKVCISDPYPLSDLNRFFSSTSFGERMSHVRALSIVIKISTTQLNHEQEWQMKPIQLRLSASLESLHISMHVLGAPFLSMVTEEMKYENESEVRRNILNNIKECMNVLAAAATGTAISTNSTNVSRLTRLELSLSIVQKSTIEVFLPSHALAPWTQLTSLRHLILHQPTSMCLYLVRSMNQLNRVDGLLYEPMFKAFIYGPTESESQIGGDVTVTTAFPHLTYLQTQSSTLPTLQQRTASRFTSSLRHLSLRLLGEEVILTNLSNLTSLNCQTMRHDLVEPMQLLNEIMKSVSQLQYLHLTHAKIHEQHIYTFLPAMKYLQSLSLRQTEIGCLECFSVSLPKLKNLELIGLPIYSHAELRHLKHIANVIMKDCDKKWKNVKPPAAPLVGIELNPGPTTDDLLCLSAQSSFLNENE